MELIEERGANPNREGDNPHNGNTSNNSNTGAKLINGVKKTNSNEDISRFYREDIEVLATSPNHYQICYRQHSNMPQQSRARAYIYRQ